MAGSQCSIFVITSIVYAVTLLVLVSEVDATATLELHMESYDNPTAKNADGGDCDQTINDDCDHKFRFALDHGDSDDNPMGSHYWDHNTGHFPDQNTIVFGRDMAGIANPIITDFTTWPPIGVKFKVIVTEHDLNNANDDVDSFVQLLRLTPAVNISVANWISARMLGRRTNDKTTLTMKYKLYCDANYYSPDCSVKCVANETCTCDPATGRCRPGFDTSSAEIVKLYRPFTLLTAVIIAAAVRLNL